MSRILLLTLAVSAAIATAQYSEGPVALNACAATSCLVGTTCVEENGVARCVGPNNEGNNCTVQFEEWRQCATCEATCEKKNPMCNKMCQPGRCMCRQGFFRSKDGKCVTENDCDTASMTSPSPVTCSRANEEYKECANPCEKTCKNKDQEMLCIAMCKPPACQCKNGFYRADNGDCVPAEQCAASPQCKKNEGFASCSSMCEPQCGQFGPIPCILMCGPPKCQCTSGFYRNSKNECVTREECGTSTQCKKNQVFNQCSTVCQQKCGEYEVRPCMAMCGPPKCQCDRGFYLDNHGECVTRAECEAQSVTPKTPSQSDCKPNELFRECSSQCEEKCGEPLARACPASCGPPMCQCDVGFFRNSVGDCVQKSDCEIDQPLTCNNIDCISGMVCEMNNGKPTCVKPKLTCMTVKCSGGHHCEITPEGTPKCIPDGSRITCANVRCAGPCTDTPTGPQCGPRPQILPISVGPSSSPAPGCPPNEEIRNCTNKCNEPFCGDENFARRCALVCLTPECECMEGFVRDGAKGCVKREDCTKKDKAHCRANEERKLCGNPCMEPFCGDELVDLNCPITTECRPSSCECKQGFVRDRRTMRCIRREQCPSPSTSPCARKNCGIAGRCVEEHGQAKCVPLFPSHTTPIEPSVAAAAPPTSDTTATLRYPTLPDSCDKVRCLDGGTWVMEEVKCISGPCKPVPKCKGGSSTVASFAASNDGTPSTGYGSVYQPFAENCGQLSCKFGEECTMERVPCFAHPCKKMAVCRPKNTICHKEHEVWDQCYHECGPTCQNRDPVCTEICGPGGCICDTFYIRDEVSGNCVRLEDCPSTPSTRAIPIEKPRALKIDEPASYDSPSSVERRSVPPPPPPTCENFDCPVGQMCTLPPMACPVPPCTRRPTCVRNPNNIPGDEIVPTCDAHQCPTGQKCILKQVLCIRAPCHPIPDCVFDMEPPICTLTCPYGQTCVMEIVFCKKAPCPKRPSCRLLQVDPVPQTCAAVTCLFGEECVLEPLPCLVAPCPNRAICKPIKKTCSKKNEIWSQCFTGCEATCQTRLKACTLQCGPGGCQCDSGYIRNERTGECVLERECPNQCKANEQYDLCFHGCEATCDQPNPACTEQCGPGGCRCANGFVRDTVSKRCVRQAACPRRSG